MQRNCQAEFRIPVLLKKPFPQTNWYAFLRVSCENLILHQNNTLLLIILSTWRLFDNVLIFYREIS